MRDVSYARLHTGMFVPHHSTFGPELSISTLQGKGSVVSMTLDDAFLTVKTKTLTLAIPAAQVIGAVLVPETK